MFQASLSREYELRDNMKIEIDEKKEQTSSKLLSEQLLGARPDRQQGMNYTMRRRILCDRQSSDCDSVPSMPCHNRMTNPALVHDLSRAHR